MLSRLRVINKGNAQSMDAQTGWPVPMLFAFNKNKALPWQGTRILCHFVANMLHEMSANKIMQAIFNLLRVLCTFLFSLPEQKAVGELIGWDSSGCPSDGASVSTFKDEYLLDQLADQNQISSWALFGWGKGCFRVLGQIGSEFWFPWQQIAPIEL